MAYYRKRMRKSMSRGRYRARKATGRNMRRGGRKTTRARRRTSKPKTIRLVITGSGVRIARRGKVY